MPEFEPTISAHIALNFAGAEARHAHHAAILPDHLFNGLTKLSDLLQPGAYEQFGLPPDEKGTVLAEVEPFIQALKQGKLDPTRARRRMRDLSGDGKAARGDEATALDPACEPLLSRAAELMTAQGGTQITICHLMAAALQLTLGNLPQLLKEMGVDADALAAKLLEIRLRPVSRTPLLDEIGDDLTEMARQGKLEEVIGRKNEMLRMQQVLGRKDKNTPVLIGEPGVGKTAVVEGYAYRIAKHPEKTHPDFRDKRIIRINAADLVAGTGLRGDFEKRLTKLIEEASNAPEVILFIDEIHMLVGAGTGGNSSMDAANIFKPALGRGLIRLIGATTEVEYRRFIEKDGALERRFEPIQVEEPDRDTAYHILNGIAQRLAVHHKVTILPEAVNATVDLSIRYLTSRRLPDKAKDLLEDACVGVKYDALSFSPVVSPDPDAAINTVTTAEVARVVAERLGLPIGQITDDIKARVAQVELFLSSRVVGQPGAIQSVSSIIRRHYAGMAQPGRPIGVFLFAGPTGVGKTELAKAVAAFLFHQERHLIRIDMGEYPEKHSLNRLIGAPPSYVGYEQGGQLTNALRSTPYAVVLLDEVEKAAPEVMNVFLSAFDAGRITDGQGRTIDARNVIFIMTSNLGYGKSMGFAPEAITSASVEAALRGHFSPEFLNRVDAVVHFEPLKAAHMEGVVNIQIERLRAQLAPRQIGVQVSPEAIRWLTQHGFDPAMGARALIRRFQQKVVDPIGGMLLTDELKPGEIASITVENDDLTVTWQSTETEKE